MYYVYFIETSFLFCFLYLFYTSRLYPQNVRMNNFFIELYHCADDFFQQINHMNRYINEDGDTDEESDDDDTSEKNKEPEKQPEVRYEDKYADIFNKQPNSELTQDQLDGLKNNILMEHTPLGNVVFFYDNSKGSFVFYSDSTIPYRYLESVGKKYVSTYKCKQLFIDMNEELKIAEEKKNKRQETALQNASANASANASVNAPAAPQVKKDVFAKFKTYNNNVTKEVAAAPSKNTGSTKITSNDNAALLKENANRYTYEGKLANFSILKKVDKKQVDKRLAMSWTDYKQLMTQCS
jgi:hypothetical protein